MWERIVFITSEVFILMIMKTAAIWIMKTVWMTGENTESAFTIIVRKELIWN